MSVIALNLVLYAAGLFFTAFGSRLAGRCATWCCALCGFPMWVVGGTVAAVSLALPQLMLAVLASGFGFTGLAVGTALAGAVTDLGLVFALCLLLHPVQVDWGEFCRKSALLVGAAVTLLLFVRDGILSYTGTGLLMMEFVFFILDSIISQYRFIFDEDVSLIDLNGVVPRSDIGGEDFTMHTMMFPAMNLANSLKNLFGMVAGAVLLAAGASMLVGSATAFAGLTGIIQAVWAATLISFGFSLPLLSEVLHPKGRLWHRITEKLRIYSPSALPMQMLNSAILSLTFALPLSNLLYRSRLPVGAQFRSYDLPFCLLLALVLLLPPLLKKRLYRQQGLCCLGLYLLYLTVVLLLPNAAA